MKKRCMGCMNVYEERFTVCPHCGYVEGTPAKEAYHMEAGTILHGKYIVGKVIGYGGFGVTYIGWDPVLEQTVAIKEYLPSEFATRVPGQSNLTIYSGEKEKQFQIGKNKFADEAKRLARLNSVEGVVEIKDTFLANETAYIVMEYLEGETLKEKIKREGKIPVNETIGIISDVLKTLSVVHKENIIHRDIAPDNIYICNDGRIKLLDFGASRYATVQHSKSLSVILKEGYAPEEQYRSKGIQGSWSDMYAVGATMYKMLTTVTPEDAMERAENDKLKPVGKYGVKLKKSVENAMMNAMNVFAEDRTQNAEAFLAELNADVVQKKERTRKKIDLGKWPLWSKILVSCIAIVLVVSGVLLSQQSTFALEDGKTYVPEVINLKDKKAKKKIEKSNLTIKITGQEKSEKVEEGKVMTQYPNAGRVVNLGELVEVQISAGNSVAMVDVMGMDKDYVEKLLGQLGFENFVFKSKESAAPRGTVIAQSIESGKETDVDTRFVVTVSAGIGEIDETKNTKVPNLQGLEYNAAANTAAENKLHVEIEDEISSKKPVNTVLKQSIDNGNTVKQGTTVYLTLSAGEEEEQKVEVPYVEYCTEYEATSTLSAYGLRYSTSYKNSNTVEEGLVISQSIESGREVKDGTKVKLVISKGRQKVEVPDVEGMSKSAAEEEILNSDLRYTVQYSYSENTGWGRVMSVSPTGRQEKGTKVTLTVSCGTSGKLVSQSEYNNTYSDSSKYSSSKRYRYATRSKEYTSSGSSYLSGWTQYDSNSSSSTSGYYFGSYPSNSNSDGKKVEVVSKGYYYYAYGVADPNNTSDWTYYIAKSRSTVVNHMANNFSKSSVYGEPRLRYFWVISSKKYDKYPRYKTVNYCDNSQVSVKTMNADGSYYMDLNMYYYSPCYKLKTTTYTYYYYRWGNWSSWSDWTSRESADGNTKREDSTVMYYVVGKSPN